ncbi:beta-lactamase-like protein [Spinellus fusiger]|nr:beta-lactamase-like protein [Spinellus fusiger]
MSSSLVESLLTHSGLIQVALMKTVLVDIPKFQQLSKRVWRVLGLNPGKFTLQGSNTYLVGSGAQKMLIDSGQGIDGYLQLLTDSLMSISPDAYISDILLTHHHADHCGGVLDILSSPLNTPAHPIQVHKYCIPMASDVCITKFPMETITPMLHDQIFTAQDTTLRIIHTPGHTKDHCTLWLEEEQSVFTGDCVLGQGTTVFDHLSDYMHGLSSLALLCPTRLYPGHGPVVEEGVAKIQSLLRHRIEREDQILRILQSDQSKGWGVLDIVDVMYKDHPQSLHMAAARGVILHLKKLQSECKVIVGETLGEDDSLPLENRKWHWVGQKQVYKHVL